MIPQPGLVHLAFVLRQEFEALTAVREYGRGRQRHVEIIKTRSLAIPGFPSGTGSGVGVARGVPLLPKPLGFPVRAQLSAVPLT